MQRSVSTVFAGTILVKGLTVGVYPRDAGRGSDQRNVKKKTSTVKDSKKKSIRKCREEKKEKRKGSGITSTRTS